MLFKITFHLLVLFVASGFIPVSAAGLEDADRRLFQVQMSIAQKGDARAQYYLGEMHEQGLGTKQSSEEAFKWYAKAADLGDRMAKKKLENRIEIEAEIKKDQIIDAAPRAPVVVSPQTVKKPEASKPDTSKHDVAKKVAPTVIAQSDIDLKENERLKEIEKQRAADREKRRAMVRAMLIERMRNPGPGLFE